MEPHPVPQDILNTEFKLFGSFTLKQFLKLIMACLVALFIFLSPLDPIIKLPLSGGTVLIGIAMAIVPRFSVWFANYIKAIFVSPRYVWVQTTEAPDILTSSTKKEISASQKVSSSKSSSKIDLEEVSLDKLLAARDNPRKSTPLPISPAINQTESDIDIEPTRQQNLDRVMGDVYKDVKPTVKEQQPVNSVPQPTQQKTQLRTQQDYVNEINQLKAELQNIVKDQHAKDKEAEILHRINDLMHELKMMDTINNEPNPVVSTENQKITDEQGQKIIEGQIVFGIVVDKSGNPVSNAVVVFDDAHGNRDVITQTLTDGRFSTDKKLVKGETYEIRVQHPEKKFNTYTITVGEGKLPAYKLRER